MMRRLSTILLLAAWACMGFHPVRAADSGQTEQVSTSDRILSDAFKNRKSKIQVRGEGTVFQVLADDTEGDRHQRFILKLATGQTLLMAHNIDIAPRLTELKPGDTIAFYGVYKWNNKGGVIHWTHHDPRGNHADGWLKRGKKTYQ